MKALDLLPSALIGAVASARSMTPMAALATAELAHKPLPGRVFLLNRPLFKFGALAMGVGELLGDKMKTAPDRIVPAGLIVRSITAAYSGAAMAPRGQRGAGAAIAVVTALGSSYIGWRVRCAAMRKYGQTKTGFAEDAVVLGSGLAIALAGQKRS